MWKTLIVMLAAATNLAACAPTLSEQPATASAADTMATCPSQSTNLPGAWVIEGFGGKGDPQLMITEQQPIVRCAQGLPVARTATLAPLQ
ncbi:MAG: hypothetical protein DRI90_14865 [Deltaproteobacteria bacterium]|nr:MAG: hypothetical protein DRI90_14865 [Deltaproteobacteria bacterium]